VMKWLGIVAGLGILLIFVGVAVAATPVEIACVFCDGEGKTDCSLCADGTDDCLYCDGTGLDDCIFCEDGKSDCVMCVDGICDSCGGTGGEWVTCWSCDGSGICYYCDGLGCSLCDYTGVCSYCNGTGEEWSECWLCDGTGECYYCNGQGWETCTFCNGEGGETCSECGGDGLVACTYCNGLGLNTCTFCNGEGRRMQVGALLIPGGIIGLIGILLIPTAFIVSKETEKSAPPSPPPISRACMHD